MAFNPEPPERYRFQQHVVVRADCIDEVNEYIDNLKTKLANECINVVSQIDQYPNSFAISADFVVMPTTQYRDKMCSAYDQVILDQARSIHKRLAAYGEGEEELQIHEIEEQLDAALAMALMPNLSSQARQKVVDMIHLLQESAQQQAEQFNATMKAMIVERIEQVRASAEHYKQALVVSADAIRLLDITIRDMQEDEEEADAE